MLVEFNLIGVLLLFISLMNIYMIYNIKDKRHKTEYHYFIILLIFSTTYMFSQGIEYTVTSHFIKYFLINIRLISYISIHISGLFFIYSIINKGKKLPTKIRFAVLIIPFICIFALLTNNWSHYFFTNLHWVIINSMPHLNYNPMWGHNLYVIYGFIIVVINLILPLKSLIKGDRFYKKTYELLIAAMIIILIGGYLNTNTTYISYISLILGSALSTLILYFALSSYESLELTPLIKETIVENINVGFCFFDENDELKKFNNAASIINLNKYSINQNVNDIFKDKPELIEFIKDSKLNIKDICLNNKYFEVKKQKVIKTEEYFGNILIFTDITSRINELNQKKLLEKEVNNRVKSNLQIVLSLLNIDLHFYPENPMIAIEDTRLRLNYMARLHETIYKSNNLKEINIKEYYPKVAQNIKSQYNSSIKIKHNIEDYMINTELAINLGIILMEILKNTINYGFPNENEGNFYIKFRIINNECVLDLCNDGEPLSDNFNIETMNTLGMTIIKSLIKGIEGKISTIPCEGAHFRIKFPTSYKD